MQLIKSAAAEGVWFSYAGDAEFKIRRIPTGLEKESYFKHFGRKTEVRRKGGAVISETNVEEAQQHNQEMARYALVDSRNVLVPGALIGVNGFDPDPEGMVKLDGRWTDEIRRVVLAEVLSLSAWVLEKANSLTTRAAEEEAELGKTS
jgi:hypothetical protein